MTKGGTNSGDARNGHEAAFDRLVELARSIFDAPIVLISTLEGDKAVMRSNVGDWQTSIAREASVSTVLVKMGPGAVLVVEDALADPQFCNHPFVTRPQGLRSCFAASITLSDGRTVGALAVADRIARARPDDRALDQLRLLAGIAADILDQTEASRVIDEKLGTLGLAEQMSGVGRWKLDLATGAVDWSDEVYRIHGVTRETFDPSYGDAVAFYRLDDQQVVRDTIAACMETGEEGEFQLRIVRTDGEERVVMSRCRAEQRDGQTVALYGVFQDVTERVRTEEVIRASEARYRLLADNSTDVIATYGLDGMFRYLSPAVEGLMGFRTDEMVGRPFTSFIHSDDVERVRKAFVDCSTAAIDAPTARIPYRAIRKDGETIWLEAHPKVIRDERGRPVAFQDVVRDITETKALEDQLIAARDAAEHAAQAKTEFLANMSHELRTPLTSVIGFSGLLRDSPALPEAERRYVDRIATASDALLGVINDILD
ncbi:MAG: PAS domain S-box protein, partial [Brevundimonas sp.]|nr:PAS domain S-box protein [Brevundimonas sp.]